MFIRRLGPSVLLLALASCSDANITSDNSNISAVKQVDSKSVGVESSTESSSAANPIHNEYRYEFRIESFRLQDEATLQPGDTDPMRTRSLKLFASWPQGYRMAGFVRDDLNYFRGIHKIRHSLLRGSNTENTLLGVGGLLVDEFRMPSSIVRTMEIPVEQINGDQFVFLLSAGDYSGGVRTVLPFTPFDLDLAPENFDADDVYITPYVMVETGTNDPYFQGDGVAFEVKFLVERTRVDAREIVSLPGLNREIRTIGDYSLHADDGEVLLQKQVETEGDERTEITRINLGNPDDLDDARRFRKVSKMTPERTLFQAFDMIQNEEGDFLVVGRVSGGRTEFFDNDEWDVAVVRLSKEGEFMSWERIGLDTTFFENYEEKILNLTVQSFVETRKGIERCAKLVDGVVTPIDGVWPLLGSKQVNRLLIAVRLVGEGDWNGQHKLISVDPNQGKRSHISYQAPLSSLFVEALVDEATLEEVEVTADGRVLITFDAQRSMIRRVGNRTVEVDVPTEISVLYSHDFVEALIYKDKNIILEKVFVKEDAIP